MKYAEKHRAAGEHKAPVQQHATLPAGARATFGLDSPVASSAATAQLMRTAQLMNHSPRIQALNTQAAALQRGPAAASQSLQFRSAVVQRVLIGEEDITSETPEAAVIAALGWTKFFGITKTFDRATLEELYEELKDREDLVDVLKTIREDLDEEDGENEAEEVEEKQQDTDFDPFGFGQEQADQFMSPEEEEEARKKAADEFGWTNYPDQIKGYKKLGVHETAGANIATLVANGPDPGKMGKGHGSGKGPGFYVTHVGQKTLYNAVKAIAYENNFVAVYIKDDVPEFKSPSPEKDDVATLDEMCGNESRYYRVSGGSEIIIPERVFGKVRIVSRQEDIAQWP